MSKDNEYQACHYLGLKQIAHFIDLNPQEKIFDLSYISMTKRCDESERRIQMLISIAE